MSIGELHNLQLSAHKRNLVGAGHEEQRARGGWMRTRQGNYSLCQNCRGSKAKYTLDAELFHPLVSIRGYRKLQLECNNSQQSETENDFVQGYAALFEAATQRESKVS